MSGRRPDWTHLTEKPESAESALRRAHRAQQASKTKQPWWMKEISLPRVPRPTFPHVDWKRFWTTPKQVFAEMNRNQQIVVVIACATFLFLTLFAWFFWPTQYRYDTIRWSDRTNTVRTHRITGKTSILTPFGWK